MVDFVYYRDQLQQDNDYRCARQSVLSGTLRMMNQRMEDSCFCCLHFTTGMKKDFV